MRIARVMFLIAAFCLAPGTALACLCGVIPQKTAAQMATDVRRELARAVAVFSGEVIGKNVLAVHLKVDTVWKGELSPEFAMSTGASPHDDGVTGTSCDFGFEVGRQYVVFAYGRGLRDMHASSCTLTTSLPEANDTVMHLHMLVLGRPPAGPNAPRTIAVIGGALKPGVVPWTAGMTVADAVALAGGLNPGRVRPDALSASTITRRQGHSVRYIHDLTAQTVLLADDDLWVGRHIR